MTMRSVVWALALSLCTATAGCGVTADLSQRSVRPPTLMVATPIPRTLYIVTAPGNVEDAFPVRGSRHSVIQFRSFVGEALRRTLQPYFASVEIVSSPPAAPPGTAVVADVRVDGVEARDLPVGGAVYTSLHLQWAFAIRLSEASEYAFTFAGSGVSDHAYRSLGEGFEQMMLSAINGLMEGWTENDVFNLLRGAITSGSGTSGAETGPVQ